MILTVIVLALTVSAMVGSAGRAATDSIRIAFEDKDQPPYYLGDGKAIDWEKPGLAVEIVKAAALAAGLQPVFVRLPWLRCLDSLQDGQVDAIFNASFSQERLKFGLYPGSGDVPDPSLRVTTLSYSFYRRRGTPVAWDGKTLSGQFDPIGVVHGFSITRDLIRQGLPVQETGSNEQVFKMLSAGRLPVVALLTVMGDRLLKSAAYPDIEAIDPPISRKDYFLMVSYPYHRAHPAQAALLWSKIGALRDAMTAQLAAKYAD